MIRKTHSWIPDHRQALRLTLTSVLLLLLMTLPTAAQRRAQGEVVNAHGIITTPPEGTVKYFKRGGMSVYYQNSRVSSDPQEGMMKVVETEDGSVYFRDFLSRVASNTWVRGTRSGSTITIPQGQLIDYDDEVGFSVALGWATYDITHEDPWTGVDGGDITLTVSDDGQQLTLNGTGIPGLGYHMVAAVYAHNGSFAGYGDYETVLTLDATYTEPDLVALPAGAQVLTWNRQTSRYSGSGGWRAADGTARVAFVGDEVYLSGLFEQYPNAWIVGTLSGSTVTFKKLQYVGSYSSTPMYATGSTGYRVDETLQDFTMTYDAAARRLTSSEWLMCNASLQRVSYLEAYTNIVLQEAVFTEPVIATGTAVDDLPYQYDFADLASSDPAFGVYDANRDNHTWGYDTTTKSAVYQTNNLLDADDWLVSPAIRLEAGKVYKVGVRTKATSPLWTERIELRMGREAKVSALTTSVIPVTDVPWFEYQALENDLFMVSETGYYHFGIHAVSEAAKNYLYVQSFYVSGPTATTVPAAATGLGAEADAGTQQITVSFTAPAVDLTGQPLTSNMTVSVERDGVKVGEVTDVAPGSTRQYVDGGLTYGWHTYRVLTDNSDGEGRWSEPVSVYLSATAALPLKVDFTQSGSLDQFLVIDANADGYTWTWEKEYSEYGARYAQNPEQAADDWLVSPAVRLEAGRSYRIAIDAGCVDPESPETFDVWLGRQTTPAGMTTEVIGTTTIDNTETQTFDNEVTVSETGYYYVGIHAASAAYMWDLFVTSLTIEEGAAPNTPAAPSVTATAAAEGALSVNVSVTAPVKTVGGDELTTAMTVSVLRNGEPVHTIDNVAAGATVQWTDTQVTDGICYYQAMASDSQGQGPKSLRVQVYVGTDTPTAIDGEVTVTDMADHLSLSWTAVSATGIHGGYVNPADVTYEIWRAECDDSWDVVWWSLLEKVGEVTGQTTADIAYVPNEQTPQYFAVRAVNGAGEGEAAYTRQVLTGRSYDIPFYEGFSEGQLHYYWDVNGVLTTSDDATDGDGKAVELQGTETGRVYMHSGKISLRSAANPMLLLDAKSSNVSQLQVLVSTDGGDMQPLQTVSLTPDYQHISLPIASLREARFIQIGLQAYVAVPATVNVSGKVTQKGDLVTLDAVRIVDLVDKDLSMSLSARSKIRAGQTATITAMVTNKGTQDVSGYEVKITANGAALLQQQVTETLAAFQSRTFSVDLETTVFQTSPVAVEASVTSDGDAQTEDNIVQTIMNIVDPGVAGPQSLTAVCRGSGGTDLSWQAPLENIRQVSESFEDQDAFPPFSLGGITPECRYGSFDDWLLYDGNGINVYRISGLVVPNSAQPSAWQVCRPSELTEQAAQHFTPHSGEQFLWSFCPSENGNRPAADHWLISPSLSEEAQTVTFYARCITNIYDEPETFEVLASATDNRPESFSTVATLSTTDVEWTLFTADLPEGTRYFAIRHTSEDVFGLLIDDITYEAGDGGVAQYNIYYEGKAVCSVTGEDTAYTLEAQQLQDGERTFAVTAVYANGRESRPAMVTIHVDTAVRGIYADETMPVDVYSIDGKLISRQAKTLSGLRGVYVINGKTVMLK